MKKLGMFLMLLVAMQSHHVFAQSVTITLMPGWNWISIPLMDTLDFETALGSFTPAQGDLIKSKWSNAHYRDGQWLGQISQFYPGYGYMYKSNRPMPVTVTFNAQQPAPQVIVTTAEPTDITTNSATCGGNVASSDGNYVFVILRGICWSTNPNPTFNDNYVEVGNGIGSFSASITDLTIGTTYYVRAFAVTGYGTYYGNEVSFTPNHTYVDLGLPSGTLWASCNMGADVPEDYGDYFAWGEIEPKDYYDWSTYLYCIGSRTTLTKYCSNSSNGYNGFTDGLNTLLPEDDVATVNWGTDWRIPTYDEWQELAINTTDAWTIRNGVYGRLFTASNGNSIFIPAAGSYHGEYGFSGAGSNGYYWSKSLSSGGTYNGWEYNFSSVGCGISGFQRYMGLSVRPVRSLQPVTSQYTVIATPNVMEGGTVTNTQQDQICTLTAIANACYTFTNWTENDAVVSTDATYTFTVNANRTLVANFTYNGGSGDHAYVDLGLPSGTLWATCNVGATNPEEYGAYFAWGETQPKATYNWSNYQYCNGSSNTLTKYCSSSVYGYNGFIDNLTTLLPEDDAATTNWGNDWRMPTQEEWQELLDNTTMTWTTYNGVNGRLFTASNGNNLFLPAAGYYTGSSFYSARFVGSYWSSSLKTGVSDNAWDYGFNSDITGGISGNFRFFGFTVRPVFTAK